ncbi:MAG: DNA repair protein RadC [Erysipelotrichaceae bacterium]|nr:DNA repair protein RadC [Erysipelotrichaceae bacterium]
MDADRMMPREKALMYGIQSLDDKEVLALIIKSAYKNYSVFELVEEILEVSGGFENLLSLTYEELIEIKGIKKAKALEILAILEVARRLSEVKKITRDQLKSPDKTIEWIRYNIAYQDQEEFFVIYLDNGGRILRYESVFKGCTNGASVGIDIIIRRAILNKSTMIVIAHNHPSEDVHPSPKDIEITGKIADACTLVGIRLLDHIIVSRTDAFSFKINNLL